MNKSDRRPVIDPVLEALKSRRVIIALVTLFASLLTVYVPEWDAVREELLFLIMVVAGVLIGGISIEDAALAARQATIEGKTPGQGVRGVFDAVLDEIAGVPDEPVEPVQSITTVTDITFDPVMAKRLTPDEFSQFKLLYAKYAGTLEIELPDNDESA